MILTLEYFLAMLGQMIHCDRSNDEKIALVEALHHAALNHIPKQPPNALTEKKVGNEKEKNEKKKKGQKKRNVKEKK